MSEDPLLGTKLKIERAERHIVDAHAQILTFFRTDGDLIRKVVEPDGGYQALKVTLTRSLPPNIPATVGDAVANLRSALDHLIFDLATNAGNVAPERTHFPFARDLEGYESKGTQGKIKLISQEARDLLATEVKPYAVGGNAFLCALNEVRNCDIHRRVVPVAFAAVRVNAKVSVKPPIGAYFIEAPRAVRFDKQNTAVLMRFPPGEAQTEADVGVDVAFGDLEVVDGQPVVTTLHQFASMTRGIVSLFEERIIKA